MKSEISFLQIYEKVDTEIILHCQEMEFLLLLPAAGSTNSDSERAF